MNMAILIIFFISFIIFVTITVTYDELDAFFSIDNVHESDFAVFGRKGRGKTLYSVIEAYHHHLDGLTVYSNCKLNFDYIYNPHMIFDYEELQNACILIDEYKACDNAFNLITQIVIKGRKNNLFFYFTAQKKTFVHPDIRNQCVQIFPRFNEKTNELSVLRIAIDEHGTKELDLNTYKIFQDAFDLYDTTESPPILTLEDKLIMILKKSGCTIEKRSQEEFLPIELQVTRERLKINLEINYGDKKEKKKILKDYDKGDLNKLIERYDNEGNKSNRETIYKVKGYNLTLLKQEVIKDERFYNDAINELNSRFNNRNIVMVFELYLNGYKKDIISKHYNLQPKTVNHYIKQCFSMLTRKRNNEKLPLMEKLYFKHLKVKLGHVVQAGSFKGKHVDFIDSNYKKVISFKAYKEKNLAHGIKRIAKSEMEVAIEKGYGILFTQFDFRKHEFNNLHFAVHHPVLECEE